MVQSRRLFFCIVILVFLSFFFSLTKGSTFVPFSALFTAEQSIILQLRLTRTAAAFVSGGLLALAGSLMQLLLQNPLADPYALGISGGAAVFTLFLMILGVNEQWLLPGAWTGSLFAMLCIFLLARKHRWHAHTLLLSGIALACGFSACVSFLLLFSANPGLHGMLFWLAGDLNAAHFPWLEAIILSVCYGLCALLSRGLNLLTRGEQTARALGLPLQRYQILLYLLSSLCTAAAVSLIGCIGFIGLLVPHFTRQFTGYDQRVSLPAAVLLGGGLLVCADTFTRTVFAPQQIPVGIVIAMLGVPAFIWVLQK